MHLRLFAVNTLLHKRLLTDPHFMREPSVSPANACEIWKTPGNALTLAVFSKISAFFRKLDKLFGQFTPS